MMSSQSRTRHVNQKLNPVHKPKIGAHSSFQNLTPQPPLAFPALILVRRRLPTSPLQVIWTQLTGKLFTAAVHEGAYMIQHGGAVSLNFAETIARSIARPQ